MSSLLKLPYAEYKVNEDGTIDHIHGIVGDLWHGLLERSLNFSTKLSLPPDGKWGNIEEDGSWNRLVGGLISNRSQIVVTSLYETQARLDVIEFCQSYAEAVVRIFIKYPQREASWTTFLKTFHLEVWLCLFCLYSSSLYVSIFHMSSVLKRITKKNHSTSPMHR
jgi:hypothetical protein